MPQFLFVHNVIVSVFSAPLPLLSYSKTLSKVITTLQLRTHVPAIHC